MRGPSETQQSYVTENDGSDVLGASNVKAMSGDYCVTCFKDSDGQPLIRKIPF